MPPETLGLREIVPMCWTEPVSDKSAALAGTGQCRQDWPLSDCDSTLERHGCIRRVVRLHQS
eukprot:3258399-Rhodomonas_salina.1